ncbi:TPA: glycosyltransferase family 4 protein [Candidatus Micrarchaeota archaeon]|nr:glycosyltransferase family 4 protein [Candidatus Micrarchaeota archaeon]
MANLLKLLVLGSKEYPVGSSGGFDSLASGGYERYTQELSSALAANGVLPVIATRMFPHQKEFEEKNGIQVHRVSWVQGFFLRNPSFNLSAFFKGLQLDYDIVFASGVFATLSGLALRLFKGKPVISRPAGIAWVQPQYPFFVKIILRALESFAYSHADAVVFLSDAEVQSFKKKMGFLPENFRVIPTGVDLSRFKAKTSRARKKKKTVLFLGRLLEVKGARFLVQAAPAINAKIIIAGKGPEKLKLEQMAVEKNLGNVVFLGQVERPEKLLAECDVFVLPSLSEGLPIAMLEAMASRKPCVVTDIGLPVENGKNALVVKPGNPEALANAINRLLVNPALAARIAKNGFRHVKTNFDWDKSILRIIVLAKELLRGRG